MALSDPLVVCREILLSDAPTKALVDERVYATPILPPDRRYPLIRLSHVGQSEHAPVGFRQAATATIQMDIWDHDQTVVATVAETALDALHGVPVVAGALYIKPTFEAREIDETAQPPLHRYRADLSVRIVRADP
jgi:hypothetical protein